MQIGLIVLAAGTSRRFGRENKLLADFCGEPLIVRAVRTLQAVRVEGVETEVLAVVSEIEGDVPSALRVLPEAPRLVVNTKAASGIGTSICAGIGGLHASIDGALIVPGDMPRLTAQLIERLIGEFVAAGGALPAHPLVGDKRRIGPVVWPRARFAELMALEGDAGGKGLLAVGPTAGVALSEAEALQLLADVDTPDDLARLTKSRDCC